MTRPARSPSSCRRARARSPKISCPDKHLGLYGAFGYDLAFQFEAVRPAIDRSDDQRDLVLHLPDEIWTVDLRRDEAIRYSYEFTVAGSAGAGASGSLTSTEGLPRETA